VQLSLRQNAQPLLEAYLTEQLEAERYKSEMIPRAARAYQLYLDKYRQMASAYPQVIISQRTGFSYGWATSKRWSACGRVQSLSRILSSVEVWMRRRLRGTLRPPSICPIVAAAGLIDGRVNPEGRPHRNDAVDHLHMKMLGKHRHGRPFHSLFATDLFRLLPAVFSSQKFSSIHTLLSTVWPRIARWRPSGEGTPKVSPFCFHRAVA